MTGSLNAEVASARRRRSRRARKVGHWLLGTALVLVAIALVVTPIAMLVVGYLDEAEAKAQEETEILYKIYHWRR